MIVKPIKRGPQKVHPYTKTLNRLAKWNHHRYADIKEYIIKHTLKEPMGQRCHNKNYKIL